MQTDFYAAPSALPRWRSAPQQWLHRPYLLPCQKTSSAHGAWSRSKMSRTARSSAPLAKSRSVCSFTRLKGMSLFRLPIRPTLLATRPAKVRARENGRSSVVCVQPRTNAGVAGQFRRLLGHLHRRSGRWRGHAQCLERPQQRIRRHRPASPVSLERQRLVIGDGKTWTRVLERVGH